MFKKQKKLCKKIGFPVLIKASAGGWWWKRYENCSQRKEFETIFSTAKSEAKKYFGNDEIYLKNFFKIQDI